MDSCGKSTLPGQSEWCVQRPWGRSSPTHSSKSKQVNVKQKEGRNNEGVRGVTGKWGRAERSRGSGGWGQLNNGPSDTHALIPGDCDSVPSMVRGVWQM